MRSHSTALALAAMSIPLSAQGGLGGGLPPAEVQLSLISELSTMSTTVDLAVTPNGRVGFVRCAPTAAADFRFMAIDMSTGTHLAIANHSDSAHALGGHDWAADAVVANDRFAITIGSVESMSGGTTFVDIYGIDTSTTPPKVIHMLNDSYPFGSMSGGRAHDLKITPSGKHAIVTCTGTALVYALGASPARIATIPLNGVAGTGSPGWLVQADAPYRDMAVDSLEVTNERAFVTARVRDHDSGGCQPVARVPALFVIDLDATPVQLSGTFDLSPLFLGCGLRTPHDIQITPDGQRGFLAGNPGSALIDLATPTQLDASVLGGAGHFFGNAVIPPTSGQRRVCDSVETDDEAAVVLRSSTTLPVGAAIRVYQHASGTLSPFTQDLSGSLDNPHDVSVNAGRAIVASDRGTWICSDLSATPPPWAFTAGAGVANSSAPPAAFLSDATTVNGRWGASIRSYPAAPGAAGDVTFADLLTGTVTTLSNVYTSAISDDRLTDIQSSRDGSWVFVRGSFAAAGSPNFFGYHKSGSSTMGAVVVGGETSTAVDFIEAGPGRVLTIGDSTVSVLHY